MTTPYEKKKCEEARIVSAIEGFIQTIGINIGGLFLPSFVTTSLLLYFLKAPLWLIGFINSLLYLVNVLQPISSALTRNISKRKPIVISTSFVGRSLFILSMFLLLGIPFKSISLSLIIFILIIASFSMSFAGTGWSTWMADIVPEEKRGGYFAFRNSLSNVAGIIAVLLAGYILKNSSDKNAFVNVYLIALLAVILGTITLFFQYEPKKNEIYNEPFFVSYKNIFKDTNFLKFVGMVSFFNFALLLSNPFFNVYYLDYLKISPSFLSYFTAAGIIFGIFGYLFFGKLSEIGGNKFIIKICLFSLIFPPIIVNFLHRENIILLGLIIFIQNFFSAGWVLGTFNTSLSISPLKNRSLYIAVFNSINSFFAIIAPVIGGFLTDLYGKPLFFIFGKEFYSTIFVFFTTSVLILIGLLLFPDYIESEKSIGEFSIRDVILRPDFATVIYRIFVSSFIPRIPSRVKLAENIGETKSSIGVVPLSKLLYDMDHEVRIAAIRNLGKISTFQAASVLMKYYKNASYLEKKEILSAFANYNFDECRNFLLKIAENTPHKTLKMESLHSLAFMINIDVKKMALEKIKIEEDINLFLVYLEILARGKVLESIPVILKRYSKIKDENIKNEILFYLSILFDVKKMFYNFASIEDEDEKEKLLIYNIKKAFKLINKSLTNIQDKRIINDIKNSIIQLIIDKKTITLKNIQKNFFIIFSQISINLNPFVKGFLEYFFKKEKLNILELELVFLEIIEYIYLIRKIK